MDAVWTRFAYAVGVENERLEHVFLIRTWRETGDDDKRAEWRGSVENLPTKQRRYFRELSDLCAFILTHQLAEHPKAR